MVYTRNKPQLLILVTIFLAAFTSCGDKTVVPVCDGSNKTYDSGIGDIITTNCTNSSCHASGSSNGDFTSYSNMSGVLNTNKFTQRVLITQDMPKGANLSQSELNELQCWADNDFPEN
jgi:hypothetical protein